MTESMTYASSGVYMSSDGCRFGAIDDDDDDAERCESCRRRHRAVIRLVLGSGQFGPRIGTDQDSRHGTPCVE